MQTHTGRLSALATFLLFLITCQSISSQQLEEMRGVKITDVDSQVLFTDENISNAMDYLASIGINAVLPVVWNGGYTQYLSGTMQHYFGKPIDPQFQGRDPLKTLLIEAHRNGIEVYPWYEYGMASWYSGGTPPFGGHLLQTYPHWACRTANGQIATKNGFDWLSGINPEVQNFLISLSTEVVDQYDVDGIEYSDRCPAMPVDGGYDSATVEIYKSEHGGNTPPANFYDAAWKRWRADKLNAFYSRVRDSVKLRNQNLFVASSPSVYPWSYDEYLQDGKTWINSGIVDHYIPQLYRYSLSEYTYELNQQLSYVDADKKDRFFAGILMNIGSYVVSPMLLKQFLQANRNKGLKGEAYFFYEGLRKNNNQLGDTLRSLFYNQPALVPMRNGNLWRPKASVVNEDSISAVIRTGKWTTVPLSGFKPNVIWANDSAYASVSYQITVPADAWYHIYAFIVPSNSFSKKARYTLRSGSDSTTMLLDQSSNSNKRWVKLSDLFLTKGSHTALTIDNIGIEAGKFIMADAVMASINRKLSPDVFITSVREDNIPGSQPVPVDFLLYQNYPNPFNPETRITFNLPYASEVKIEIFDTLGRLVEQPVHQYHQAGSHSFTFNAAALPSGVYVCRLLAGTFQSSIKMTLIK